MHKNHKRLLQITLVLLCATTYTASQLQVNLQPAVAWLLSCVSQATGLDETDSCESAIAGTAELVVKAVAQPETLSQDDAKWLHSSCFHQADLARDCWKDFFWHYNVFKALSNDKQTTCTRFTYELFTATAVSTTGILCAFEGKKSCVVEVAKALEKVKLLDALRNHTQDFQWDSSTMLSVCPVLRSTGCCATTVLKALAPIAQGFCLQKLSNVFYALPGVCLQMGYPLKPACPDRLPLDHRLFDHVLSSGNFTCAESDFLSKDLNCSNYNYHINHCPSSICDTYCGVRSSIVLEDVARRPEAFKSLPPQFTMREFLLVLGGLAGVLVVIAICSTFWYCARRMLPLERQDSGEQALLYDHMLEDDTDDSNDTPLHPESSSASDVKVCTGAASDCSPCDGKSTGFDEVPPPTPADRKLAMLASPGFDSEREGGVELLIRAFKPEDTSEAESTAQGSAAHQATSTLTHNDTHGSS